jgi:hypothetical protein
MRRLKNDVFSARFRSFLPAVGGRQCLVAAFLISLWLTTASAHDLNNSYSEITVASDSLQLAVTFDITDLARGFALDANGNQAVEREEVLAKAPEIFAYIDARVTLAVNFSPLKLERRKAWPTQDDFGNVFISFLFAQKLSGMPAEISLSVDFFEKFGAQHKNLVKIAVGEKIEPAVLSQDSPRQRFIIGGAMPLSTQIGQFVKLGIEHIFLGYDHIMFLFALIVIGGRLGNLVKIVTAFTLAHSLTLILAALEILKLPPKIIESGIALSIAYVAAENFVIAQSDHRWILTFIFGLIHGFGFANVLRDLGLPTSGLVPSLLAFNAGVEIGQLCIVAALFPLTLWMAQKKFQRHVVFGFSSVILLFGLGWFFERALGLAFMPL